MKIYLVSYVENGRRIYYDESLNRRCALALRDILSGKGQKPRIRRLKISAKALVAFSLQGPVP